MQSHATQFCESKKVVLETGVQVAPQMFDWSKIRAKSLKIREKSLKIWGKNGTQSCLISKIGAQTTDKNTWPFFGGHTKNDEYTKNKSSRFGGHTKNDLQDLFFIGENL